MRYIVLALAALVLLGGCDGDDSDNRRSSDSSILSDVHRQLLGDDLYAAERAAALDATPTPSPSPVATPAPLPPLRLEPTPVLAAVGADISTAGLEPTPALTSPSPQPLPEPEPAAGTLVHNVQLTVYTCVGDSTGAYCPGDPAFCGGTVYRGVAACGWQWACGQQFRILGDPYPDMVYTCLDRGGAVTGIDVWFYDYYAEGRPWRVQLPQPVTVELLN